MNGRIVRILLWTGLLILSSSRLFAQERWIYRYNGFGVSKDGAYSIVMDPNDNLYVAGVSGGAGTNWDLTVVSLSDSGLERWVYQYDGPASNDDWANWIVMASDGNLYAVGPSYGIGNYDFTVVSLSDSGLERWVYRYDGPGNDDDDANSVIIGSDGNVYAVGTSYGSGTSCDLAVVSLSDSGVERWVYRYNGPANDDDWGRSIVMGSDGNLYVTGYSVGSGTNEDFMVVSLTDSGVERWVYRYDGSANYMDWANSIVMGSDGNLYAAGTSYEIGTSCDFTVVSLSDSGVERWVYRYNGPGNDHDEAKSVIIGSDGNVYAAGFSSGSGTNWDFTVVSLTDTGVERWVYRYNGPGNYIDQASSIIMGSDGSLYVAGYIAGSGTDRDFTVVSLSNSGAERWVYLYDGSAHGFDGAYSIAMGSDGNLYAAGSSVGTGTSYDAIVVSLPPDVGVEERVHSSPAADFRIFQNRPNPFQHSTLITYSLPAATHLALTVYDVTGRLVETMVNGTQHPGIHQVRWNRKTNPSGVYFYRLETGESVEARKMVVID